MDSAHTFGDFGDDIHYTWLPNTGDMSDPNTVDPILPNFQDDGCFSMQDYETAAFTWNLDD
jgi:hypothetical protein